MQNKVNVLLEMGEAGTGTALWTMWTTKHLERGQFSLQQKWSEENDGGTEYVERTRVRRGKEK
jgi:hypothetical protein